MACRPDKERENAAALEVLPDLLRELDAVCTSAARREDTDLAALGSPTLCTWNSV